MIARTIDTTANRHPAFAKYARERVDIFHGTKLHVNIWSCITASIAAGFFVNTDNEALRIAATAVMAVVWLYSAVLAGFLKQWLFIFFSAMYFALPQILILPPVGDYGTAMRETQYFVSDILEYIWASPMKAAFPDISYITVSYIMFAVYMLAFIVGVRLRTTAKRSELYCKARLEQLG